MAFSLLTSLIRLFCYLRSRVAFFVGLHYHAFFTHLDLVQREPPSDWNTGKGQIPVQYLLVCSIVTVLFLYGWLVLAYQEMACISLVCLRESNETFSHQITAINLRVTFDTLMANDILLTFAILLVLFFKGVIPAEIRFSLHTLTDKPRITVNSWPLSVAVSCKILRLSRLGHSLIALTILSYALIVLTYFYINLLFLNHYLRYSLPSLLFWSIGFPLLWGYITYAIVGPGIFIMMASVYLQIRQKDALAQMRKLNHKLRNQKLVTRLMKNYSQWSVINSTVVAICVDTSRISRFFSPLLSVIFPFCIFAIGYILKLAAFPGGITLQQSWAFRVVFVFLVADFFLLISVCARVVRYFDDILVENRKFALHMQKQSNWRRLCTREKLKVEEAQVPRRFASSSFKLYFINYRITPNSFSSVRAAW